MFSLTACSSSTGEPVNNCEHVADGSGYCTLCNEIIGSTEGVLYELSDDESFAKVIGYEGTSTRVIISNEYQEKPVAFISEYAFSGCNSLTSIIIPQGITSIGDFAFRWCESLIKIDIPSSVTSLGDNLCEDCDSLDKINYSGTVDQWSEISFGENPFGYSYKLYLNDELLTSAVITSATKVADYAFYGCSSLEYAYISDNVINVGYAAFFGCPISNLTLGYSVRSVGYGAFYGCSKLVNVSLSDNLNSIGSRAFSGCSSLTTIIIPNNVISMGENVFYGCNNLTIYCKAKKQPSGWNVYWNLGGSMYEAARIPVVWGYMG